jgi:hypothetical protein
MPIGVSWRISNCEVSVNTCVKNSESGGTGRANLPRGVAEFAGP